MMCNGEGGGIVKKQKFEWVLEEVARREHMSVQEVRAEMQAAIEEGQKSEDPAVQKRWAAIPRKGKELTLEEFIAYLARKRN